MSSREKNLDYCLKCNICHTQCPVVATHLEFPGPKHLGPELERLRISQQKDKFIEIDKSIDYCSNCKRCDIACPHGVRPSYYNLKNKGKIKSSFLKGLRNWVLAHNGWWSKLASFFPQLVNGILKNKIAKFAMGLMGIANRDFPQYKKLHVKNSNLEKNKKVLYYPGCYARYNEPEIIQATVDVLEGYGYFVKIAPVECCGTPMFSNGLLNESTKLALKNVNIFTNYINNGYKIVVTCPSCGLALKEEYQDLLGDAMATTFAENVWDLFELLSLESSHPFNTDKKKYKKAFYHAPCHLIAQRMGLPVTEILSQIAVDNLIVEDSHCCGIAGTYGFKEEKFEIAKSIGEPIFELINQNAVDLVLTDCGTCKLQIAQNTNKTVKHPVILLREYLKA